MSRDGETICVCSRGSASRTAQLQDLGADLNSTARAFLAALQKALPGADRHDVARGSVIVLESMLKTVSRHERVDTLTDGAAHRARS